MSSTADRDPGRDPRSVRNLKWLDRYVISAPIMIILGSQLLWPIFGLVAAVGQFPAWRLIVPTVASVLLAAADLIMVLWSLQAVRAGRYGVGRSRLLGWSAAVVPLIAATAVTPMSAPAEQASALPLIVQLSAASAWAAVSLAYSLRVAVVGALILSAAGLVATSGATAITSDLDPAAGLFLGAFIGGSRALWILFLVAAVWSSGWMLRVVMELDRSRQLAAELAIAEERLRISRDLHDVFGRTLATVALKSELAEELARRGRVEQATKEMAAVRQLADDTGREVRGLVRGYRKADLARELAGAEDLLDSAGIRCEVTGSYAGLDQGQTSALAWVLREAVTNVIRHSRATRVMINFADEDPVTMIISNDGDERVGQDQQGTGSGLRNMADRLAEAGGTFQHRRERDWFTVTAAVPAGSAIPEEEVAR